MIHIQVLDKKRFLQQVAASRGSVYLHLDDGTVCDLKQNSSASTLFRMMDAPKKGICLSVAEPADVTGFLRYMMEAGRRSMPAS